ncbi:MAG: TIGR03617 family F420-dependent LLM class oxidoreductase [Pseudomonadales bacterium]|jgi:probable F420-dependent oxidoreductase|nr:TIGR03617 family F420-dependent LLM class oxidoreductase [Pseudomonadales bacterium]MDP7144802.1 TIGR03617 family F420-dependent LLM class oxidoreductase [Pseudomonadales bacterium]MDP7360239.1 TIGR03617 family F420-dependent LLM class oxidoreductase [Pseudomonadales bacterium]MDP7594988.1 TIGR03617 family F420-dependent LLM class oxidoreductase [Pseudomonadales bacterium]HJN53357.1 TIGR03617 family F420-dependent LLM class oxidoreductase [Pseudomonadales bacterium]|tara:strand:+ start:214 stop:1269 length:1056 start_codon:yes stop_codon:yes gene_type:complete
MKLGTGIGGWPGEVGAAAKRAEDNGYDYVTCGELSHDSMLTMTVAATSTEKVELQTGVTIAFPRSPMVLAMEAWDLQHLSKGRFSIGLGSQVKGHNERRFSVPWSAPAPRMKEYIRMMRAIWECWQQGTQAEFLGKHYTFTLMTPNFNPGRIDYPRPNISLAVVGGAMARVAGEVADGVMPHGGIMTDKYMREVLLPNVKIGLERSGRTWKDIEIAQSGYLVLGENDSDIEQNLDRMRTPLSFYGSTRTYHDVLRLHDLEDLGQKLHRLSLEGKWQEMREVITTDDLLKLTEVCTYDDYPRFIKEHREYASRTGFAMPTRTAEERERSQDIMEQLQAVETTGVPKGMEMTA